MVDVKVWRAKRFLPFLPGCVVICLLGTVSVLPGTIPVAWAGSPEQAAVARGYRYDGRSMTKLLSVAFAVGRPKLSPEEEKEITRQTLLLPLQTALHQPATILVVIGYVDARGNTEAAREIALRRVQLVIDLLHDKCQFAGSSQAMTMTVGELAAKDRANKNAVVEIWLVDP